jgi:hypothetical protein
MSRGENEMKADPKFKPVRWANICRSLYVMGHMESFSKRECLRIHALLKARVAAGDAVQIERGLYSMPHKTRKKS